MPRTANPALETRITRAAIELLDEGGTHAVTMRAVALRAGTTTPTVYQRFRDRDALLKAAADVLTNEVLAELENSASVKHMSVGFLKYACSHANRIDLMTDTFSTRFAAGEPQPVFDLLMSHVRRETALRGVRHRQVSLSIALLFMGTAHGMIGCGPVTTRAKELETAAFAGLRSVLADARKTK